jgi:hypothetical protein
VAVSPLYVLSADSGVLLVGALLVGFGAHGMWGAFPSYITERFRVKYEAPARVSAITPAPSPVPLRRMRLAISSTRVGRCPTAMTGSIAVSGLAVASMIWLGPETRDRRFQ